MPPQASANYSPQVNNSVGDRPIKDCCSTSASQRFQPEVPEHDERPPKRHQKPFPRRLTREFVLLSSHHVCNFSNKQPKGWRRLIHSRQSGTDAPELHDARKPGPARTLAEHRSRYPAQRSSASTQADLISVAVFTIDAHRSPPTTIPPPSRLSKEDRLKLPFFSFMRSPAATDRRIVYPVKTSFNFCEPFKN
jgi:hypothetical protein